MFKYFLTLIAILTTIPAMGKLSDKPSEFRDPTPKDSKGWTATTGAQNLNTSSGSIYSKLKTEIDNKTGTCDDEGAVLLLVARNIYDNGGEFAWTQVQAANANGHRYTWIDYYDPDRSSASNAVTSIRLCNPGESCNSNEYGCNTQTQTLSNLFGKRDEAPGLHIKLKTSGKASGVFTNSMNVLGYDNEENLEPTERTATHVLLGVIELKEHGAIVAPITVVGKRDPNGSGISSWINSVTYDASQKKTALQRRLGTGRRRLCSNRTLQKL